MEGRTVLILVEGETEPILGHWVKDSSKAECIRVQEQNIWFPKSVCMGGAQSRMYADEVAKPVINAYVAEHEDEFGKVYCLRVPVWLANEKEIPGWDEDVPECVTVVEPAHKSTCKMCGYPTDGSHFCPACQKAILQERAEGLRTVLDEHMVDCVEDLPKEALEAHQRRHEVKR